MSPAGNTPERPYKAAPEAVEISETVNQPAAGPVTQMERTALNVRMSIHTALTRLRADLHVVEEAIQSLELRAPEDRSKPFRGLSTSMPVAAQKPRKMVDIDTKRK